MPEGVDGPVRRVTPSPEPPEWLTDEKRAANSENTQLSIDLWRWEKSQYVEALQTECGLSRTDALLVMVWSTLNFLVAGVKAGQSIQDRGVKILEKVEQDMDEDEPWRKDDA